jgi:hypothetical protein
MGMVTRTGLAYWSFQLLIKTACSQRSSVSPRPLLSSHSTSLIQPSNGLANFSFLFLERFQGRAEAEVLNLVRPRETSIRFNRAFHKTSNDTVIRHSILDIRLVFSGVLDVLAARCE